MKKFIFTLLLVTSLVTTAQENPNNGLLPSRVTTTQRNAFTNPANGLIIYNTTAQSLQINKGVSGVANWADLNTNGTSAVAANVFCNNNDPNVATIFDDELPIVAHDATLTQKSQNTYYGLDSSSWIWNGTAYTSFNNNVNLSVGQRVSIFKTMATSAANGTNLPAAGLIELDGLIRVGLNKFDATFYKPYLVNITANAIKITFSSSFQGATAENRYVVQATIAAGANQGIDNNDITYWTSTVTETLTANVILPNGKWYEIQWFAYELGTNKNIFMTALRKF